MLHIVAASLLKRPHLMQQFGNSYMSNMVFGIVLLQARDSQKVIQQIFDAFQHGFEDEEMMFAFFFDIQNSWE
jgi:hypothetical protein